VRNQWPAPRKAGAEAGSKFPNDAFGISPNCHAVLSLRSRAIVPAGRRARRHHRFGSIDLLIYLKRSDKPTEARMVYFRRVALYAAGNEDGLRGTGGAVRMADIFVSYTASDREWAFWHLMG
jgi:hypothetical protein